MLSVCAGSCSQLDELGVVRTLASLLPKRWIVADLLNVQMDLPCLHQETVWGEKTGGNRDANWVGGINVLNPACNSLFEVFFFGS